MSYLSKWFNKNKTPQSAPIPGTSQVPNSAGGFAFAVDDWTRLDRFLILGAEGGTYYATERKLTRENARGRPALPALDGRRVVDAHRRHLGRGPRAEERSGAVRARARGEARRRRHAARGVRGAAAGGAHRNAPLPLRRVREGAGRLGPRHDAGVRALVHGDGGEPSRAPGRQVPEPRRLVAPRPAAQGAPGRQGRSPAGDLPLDDEGLGGGRRRAAPGPGAGDDLGVRAGEEPARASRTCPCSARSSATTACRTSACRRR